MRKYAGFVMIALAVLIASSLDCFSDETKSLHQQSLVIGGVTIKIGDAKSAVLNALEKSNVVTKDKSVAVDSFSIYEKESKNYQGYVSFNKNKVSGAMKRWGNYSSCKTSQLAEGIYSVVKNVTDEWNGPYSVDTYNLRNPDLVIYSTKVMFGKKYVDISVSENPKDGTMGPVQIDEHLFGK